MTEKKARKQISQNDKSVAQGVGSSPAPTLGRVIGTYKSLCMNKWSRYLRQNNQNIKESFWQRNYYEHVITSENELNLAREYIIFNPFKWSLDSENPGRILDVDYSTKCAWFEGD